MLDFCFNNEEILSFSDGFDNKWLYTATFGWWTADISSSRSNTLIIRSNILILRSTVLIIRNKNRLISSNNLLIRSNILILISNILLVRRNTLIIRSNIMLIRRNILLRRSNILITRSNAELRLTPVSVSYSFVASHFCQVWQMPLLQKTQVSWIQLFLIIQKPCVSNRVIIIVDISVLKEINYSQWSVIRGQTDLLWLKK